MIEIVNFYELLNIDPSTSLENVKKALKNAVVFLDNAEIDLGIKFNNPEQVRLIYKKAAEAFLNENSRMKYDFLGINGEFSMDDDLSLDLETMKWLNKNFDVNYSINKGLFDSRSDSVNIFFMFLKSIASLVFLVYLVPDYTWIIFFVTIAHLAIKIVFYLKVEKNSQCNDFFNLNTKVVNEEGYTSVGEKRLMRFYQKFNRCHAKIAFVRIFKMVFWIFIFSELATKTDTIMVHYQLRIAMFIPILIHLYLFDMWLEYKLDRTGNL